ncbi:MAG: hypothetical protein F4X44_11905 [Gammaproteobacteria bacterium]|nr:hypothetical protein [Gammaproteobacteria bacterium]MYD81301.1 hypothetical protein [Gammaproteobacteria bacterium]
MKSVLRRMVVYVASFSVGQLLVFGAFALLVCFAVIGGVQWKTGVLEEQAQPSQEVAESRAAWFESLELSATGTSVSPALAHPMNLPVLVLKPPGPLGQFSHRREDLHPSAGVVNGFSNEALIFRRYELESPVSLLHGGLDLLLVVLVVMPLALCLLNYNHLASEREQGRLSVLVIQGARPAGILFSRTLQCSTPLLVILVFASVVGTVLSGPTDLSTLVRFILWCTVIFAYWCFWVAICSLVATKCANSINAALASVSVWILIVVILPSGLQFGMDRFTESASKVHLLALARSAEADALGSVDQRAEALMAQHSTEISHLKIEAPTYYRSAYVANASINDRVGGLLDAHAQKVKTNHLRLDIVQAFSPATAAFRALQESSGAGYLRASNFEHQVRSFFRHYFELVGVATLQGRRLTLDEAEEIGTFNYRESVATSTVLSAIAVLLVLSALLLFHANATARKLEVSHL